MLLLLAATGLAGTALSHASPGGTGRPVIAVFPPWWDWLDEARAVAAAEGTLVGLGRWPGLLLVQSEDPGFAARLRNAGAWFLLDRRVVPGCSPASRPAG